MTVLQALDRYYDRMAERGDVTPPGWSIEPVGVVVVISADGLVVGVRERLDAKGKRGQPMLVPKWFGRAGQGSTPFIFWDNTAYALGVSAKDPGKTKRDHEAFTRLHFEQLASETDDGLVALRRFLERWSPDQFAAPLFSEKMMAFNVAFRLEGGDDRELIHERAAAAVIVERLRAAAASTETAFCLVSGEHLPVVRLHPKVKGVNGTASPEVPLVSFNEPAFESYGKEQGYNAPTSQVAAIRYTSALTALLDRNASRNRLQRGIGDATVIFWADASGVGEAAAKAAENLFAALLEPPDDASEAAKVRDALEQVRDGRPVKDLGDDVKQGTRFHVLGLAPNAARLSIRYWLVDDFEVFAERLALHHRDLALNPPPRGWSKPPSIQRLLVRTTALLEKFDNIPPLLAGEVTRAVLSGGRYPRTLLMAAIMRLRAGDDPGSGWHAAVIKASINRSEDEKVPEGLDPENKNNAYQLGRLFALLEAAQYAALGRVNAPIGDRFYGAASSTPARVFGSLLRGLRNHLSDARKRGRGGWIEPRIAEVMKMLPPELPRTLRLEDQGRFAVGYYHERATRAQKPTEADDTGDAE